MKPVKFKESNTVVGSGLGEGNSLPAYKDSNTLEKGVVMCWGMGLWGRIKFLFTGRIYVSVLTFGDSVQPVKLSTTFNKPELDLNQVEHE